MPRFKSRMRDLGLSVRLYDAAGEPASDMQAGGAFCQSTNASSSACLQCADSLAREVVSGAGPQSGCGDSGCCLLGLPIFQRRRVAGAVVACYPTHEMAQSGSLSAEQLTQMQRQDCRNSSQDSDHWLKVIEWLLQQEQSLEVTQAELGTLSANLSSTYEELSLVYRISGDMRVTQRPRDFLDNICRELAEVMSLSGAFALLRAHQGGGEDEVILAGDLDLNADQALLLASTQIAPRLTGEARAVVDNNFTAPVESGLGTSVRNFIAVPLCSDKSTIGMIVGVNNLGGDFDSAHIKLISSVANQAAIFLANSRLFADVQDLLMGVLHALTSSIDAKDPYTCGHSQRVAIISRRLAESCGFDTQKVQRIYLMGLLHDVGKIGVPESVLCKTGRLTDEEFELIKKHLEVGAKILGGIRQLDDIVVGMVTHHERPDGRGYPRRLKGEEVPIEGRIIGLADCFDAMTSNRTYRTALPLEMVVKEIQLNAGKQFDPDLVEKFLAMDLERFLDELRQPTRTVLPSGAELATAAMTTAMPAAVTCATEPGGKETT